MAEQTSNGNGHSRLDRIEKIVLDLAESQEKLIDSQKHLLFAQGVLYEETTKLTKRVDKLAEVQQHTDELIRELRDSQKHTDQRIAELHDSQKHTDERINALIDIVDDLVRRPPPPPQ